MTERRETDLELAAFRFIAGEMGGKEASEFEQQLATDQEAREAVCRAVRLVEQLVPRGPSDAAPGGGRLPPATRSLRGGRQFARPIGWMALGAVAASLVMMFIHRSEAPSNPVARTEHARSESTAVPTPQAASPAAAEVPLDLREVGQLDWSHLSDLPAWTSDLRLEPAPASAERLTSIEIPTTIPPWTLTTPGEFE